MNSWNTSRTKAIIESFEFKRLEKIKDEEPLDEVKILDLLDMPPLEGDDKKIVDLADMLLLECDVKVKQGIVLKTVTPNKLLTGFPVLLAQKSWK